ncbi:YibE/F family protein [Aeromicrobium sp.]|uniref:YibE/F family protein n=1 Tax=Aeromicrobium sp. TaxID=1871063 RepID=UPI0025BD8826|nr:YibE/F family protein [Aeromicrobium sp.]
MAAIAVATGIAMAILWPSSDDVPRDIDPFSGEGVTTVEATVTSLEPFDCGSTGEVDIDSMPTVAGSCANVTADVETGEAAGQTAEFQLNSTNFVAGTVAAGDRVRLVQYQIEGGSFGYEFRDFVRGFPLAALAIVFAVLVALIGRLRGLFALLGIGVTLVALMTFVLPGILTGQSPLLIAVVGSTGIMIAVLYLAHGISIRTTSALFGTLFGIAFTALAGLIGTDWSHLTGLTSEDDALLLATAPQLQMQGIVAASMVIAGLGVLNDVTVTQASAVWELRALQPFASAWDLFRSAMRIGRDHIASSVYTLVFAYAGSAMTVMLLITAYQRGLVDVLTSGEIAQEVVRTLVGAIGLVLAVPVTTAFAVWLAPPARDPGSDREPDRAVDDSGSGATAAPATWADERPSAGRRVRRPEDA